MSRRTRLDMVGKIDQIEREGLAGKLTELVSLLRQEWWERCQQEAEAEASPDGSAGAGRYT